MKLVMTLLVRDNEDILKENLDFHFAQGIDFIIVTDNNSIDNTPEILRNYAAGGRLRVIHEPSDDYSQHRWVTRMARMAASEYEADWVINNDADEFWWPKMGSLKEAFTKLPKEVNAINVQRLNYPPVEEKKGNNLSAGAPFWQWMVIRDVASKNSLGMPLPPKMAHRADPQIEVATGNHSVEFPAGRPVQTNGAEPIVIFHFPLRSYSQFENKIKLGGAAFERNQELPKNVGTTWRELYVEYQKGSLRKRYDKELIHAGEVEHRIFQGELIVDTRLMHYLDNVYG
jgi:hypothetical protein